MSNDEPKFTYTKEEIRAATADMASTAAQHAVAREDAARNPQPVVAQADEGFGAYTVHDEEGRKVTTLAKIREGLFSEARAHQWEHTKANAGRVAEDVLYGRAQARTFTREEVLTVLKALGAELKVQGIHSAGLLSLDRARAIFENME